MEIDKLIEGADIMRFIKAQKIQWLGHIQRMDQPRPARRLLDWKPMGTRPVGRPRQRWQEDVMEDLKRLKIKNRKATAKDRNTWRDLAEKAKTHKETFNMPFIFLVVLWILAGNLFVINSYKLL
jgi:hypothetical protein